MGIFERILQRIDNKKASKAIEKLSANKNCNTRAFNKSLFVKSYIRHLTVPTMFKVIVFLSLNKESFTKHWKPLNYFSSWVLVLLERSSVDRELNS